MTFIETTYSVKQGKFLSYYDSRRVHKLEFCPQEISSKTLSQVSKGSTNATG